MIPIKHSGFTLLELMIVVSLIGILSMLALPSYQNYTKRARFAEVISVADTYKTAVALALQDGTLIGDINDGSAGIPAKPAPTKNLASINVEHGVITATSTAAAGDATYILKPSPDGTVFAIGGTCVALGYCRS